MTGRLPYLAVVRRPVDQVERDRMRSLAWWFRNSRSCRWNGADKAAELVGYAASLVEDGADVRAVMRELLCAVRCCGDCDK